MDITVIGATGGCGREIACRIVRDRLLESREILQLISSNPQSRHPHLLHGLRADLQDAHAEIMPEIDVTDDDQAIIGDVVVFAAGVTVSTDPTEMSSSSRDKLAQVNRPVFERFARAIARTRPNNPPTVIIVTNPVELGVHIFCQYLPREYVIGMGAFSDSLRFRGEIAHDLGIRRQRVHGYVLGEHGANMVPLWSTVRVQGMSQLEWSQAKKHLRRGLATTDFTDRLIEEQQRLASIILADNDQGPGRLLEEANRLPPDLRVVLKPFAIHFTQAKTINATADTTLELMTAIIEGRPIEIAAQYQHQGESDIYGPFGNRVIIAGTVNRLLPIEGYTAEEMEQIQRAAQNIGAKIKEWTADDD